MNHLDHLDAEQGKHADTTVTGPKPNNDNVTRETLVKGFLKSKPRVFPDNPSVQEMAVIVIDHMLCCDFLEDLSMSGSRLRGRMKEAHRMLSEIYQIAHAADATNGCFDVHKDWRRTIKERYEQAIVEETKPSQKPQR